MGQKDLSLSLLFLIKKKKAIDNGANLRGFQGPVGNDIATKKIRDREIFSWDKRH